jgi:LPXTG-motif cell wall-anchored protein
MATASAAGARLADTGSDLSGLLGLMALMLAAGIGLTVAGRRRLLMN